MNIPPRETEHVYIAIDSKSGREDAPIYNWIEIDPSQGGNGISCGISDGGNGNNKSKCSIKPFWL